MSLFACSALRYCCLLLNSAWCCSSLLAATHNSGYDAAELFIGSSQRPSCNWPYSNTVVSPVTALLWSWRSSSSMRYHSWKSLPRKCPTSYGSSSASVHAFHGAAQASKGNPSSNVKSPRSPGNWSTGGAFPILRRLVAVPWWKVLLLVLQWWDSRCRCVCPTSSCCIFSRSDLICSSLASSILSNSCSCSQLILHTVHSTPSGVALHPAGLLIMLVE